MIQSRVPPVTSSVYRNGVRRRTLDRWSKPFPVTDSFEYPLAASCPQPQAEGTRTQTMDYLHTETTHGACLRPTGLATRQNRVRIGMQYPAEIPEVQFPDSFCRFSVVQFSEPPRVQFPDNLRIIDYQYRLLPLRLPTSRGNGCAYDGVTIGIYQTSYCSP